MKLAEALQERADINRRVIEIRNRLETNALVQEGETPSEQPEELLRELEAALSRLETLMVAINRTNCKTECGGMTLMEQIAHRDVLKMKVQALRNTAEAGARTVSRASHSEIRILSTVDVRGMQKEADRLSAELRQVDNAIQAANWTTELELD